MRTVDNAGEWYSKELFDGDKRNADKPMRMSYVADDNTLVGFIIWRIEVRGVGSDVTDWPEVRIADVLELYVAPESRGK